MATTQTTDLFIPEVVDSEIKDGVKNNTVFMNDAEVDYELVGQAGDSVTFPAYTYIGDAEDLEEDGVLVPAKLTQTTTKAYVEEFGKAAEVSYKAETQGLGSAVEQATKQIKVVISNGADKKLYGKYLAEAENVLDQSAVEGAFLNYETVVDATSKLDLEDDVDTKLYIHPEQVKRLIVDPHFVDVAKYSQGELSPKLTKAEVGRIHDVRVFKTKNILKDADGVYHNILVAPGAAKVKFQSVAEVESGKDILARKIILAATTLVAMKTVNQNKLVVIKTK